MTLCFAGGIDTAQSTCGCSVCAGHYNAGDEQCEPPLTAIGMNHIDSLEHAPKGHVDDRGAWISDICVAKKGAPRKRAVVLYAGSGGDTLALMVRD